MHCLGVFLLLNFNYRVNTRLHNFLLCSFSIFDLTRVNFAPQRFHASPYVQEVLNVSLQELKTSEHTIYYFKKF